MPEIETLLSFAAQISAILGLISIIFIAIQAWLMKRASESTALSAIYSHAQDVRQVLAQNARLRRYILESAEISRDDEDYDLAWTIAEMYLNYFEHLVLQQPHFSKTNREAWCAYVQAAVKTSPLLKAVLAAREAFYNDELLKMARAD